MRLGKGLPTSKRKEESTSRSSNETAGKISLDKRDIRIISKIYYNQKANIWIEQETTEEIEIKKGVRQGCILSPILFNLYSEDIINRALSEQDIGIKINGIPINNLRYADDTVVITETPEDLQILINRIVEECSEEIMVVSKSPQNLPDITAHGKKN